MEFIRNEWIRHFKSDSHAAQHIRIISPFITERLVRELMSDFHGDRIEVITRFNLSDFRSGVSSLQALRYLVERGSKIQGIRNLHSKVFIFDQSSVIFGSANLTAMAFYNNFEFGMRTEDTAQVETCIEYFDWLRERGGYYLNVTHISAWEQEIGRQQPLNAELTLPDYGTDPGTNWRDKKYWIKLFGKSDNRVDLDFHTREEIDRAHCHYALCFPNNGGQPQRYRDGDIVYMARMLEGTDYSIFGRAECLAHVQGRDIASDEEMDLRDWKARWGIYIRIREPVFIDATMRNCPKMSSLIQEFGPESYESTSRRFARGERQINPWNSLRQKPDVQLTRTSAMWLGDRFDECILQYGKVEESFILALDPGSPY